MNAFRRSSLPILVTIALLTVCGGCSYFYDLELEGLVLRGISALILAVLEVDGVMVASDAHQ